MWVAPIARREAVTPSRVDETEEAVRLRAKRGDVSGLGLFDALASQREAAPEVGRVAKVEYPGPSTEAKRIAKARADRTLTGRRGVILLALRGYGPMTRLAIHKATNLSENSVNSAVHAMLESKHVRLLDHLDPATERSIVAINEGEG